MNRAKNISESFLNSFANWNGLEKVFLTFDIDWAPDYMISCLVDTLREFGFSATFFATHPSDLLKSLEEDSDFEIAHHLNLAPGSTQGTDIGEAVTCLRKHYPGRRGNRFHLLDYSYPDLIRLSAENYLYDVSSLRFNCPFLLPAMHRDLKMPLLTYFWEDGVSENASLPHELELLDLESPGLKIINFHPMNIFINCPDAIHRRSFQNNVPCLPECPEKTALSFRFDGKGTGTLFLSLLRFMDEKRVHTGKVFELVEAFEKELNQ